MPKQDKSDIREASGCLGSIPSRAGMSFLVSQMMMKQMAAGGTVTLIDKGNSFESLATEFDSQMAEQRKRVMRVGRKSNSAPVTQTMTEPWYRKFDKRR